VLGLESYESRLHRYAMLNEAGRCAKAGCGADAAVKVNIETPDKMTGSTAYYCALHAEEGAAEALAFVMRGRR
jgi:hypothetical protein